MKYFSIFAFVLLLGVGFSACNTVGEVLPPNDEVLIYKLPYDLTYLRTMEALDTYGTWQLQETDKENGRITVRDTNYKSMNDSDQRVINFLVKRLGRDKTSVSIDPASQKVYGGDKLLNAVGAVLGRETAS